MPWMCNNKAFVFQREDLDILVKVYSKMNDDDKELKENLKGLIKGLNGFFEDSIIEW